MSKLFGRQAIVIGAGMGGLTAAGALTDYFEHIFVLDRDELPASPAHRAGTPQSRHAHVLLCGGARRLGELFPSFEQEMVRAGAVVIDFSRDARLDRPGFDPFPQRSLGLTTCCASRILIEFVTRQFVEQQKNVTLVPNCRVQAISAFPDGTVTSVQCEYGNGRAEELFADLVIDASGRGMLTLQLLKSLGYPQPDEESIGMNIGYSTALFSIPDDAPQDWVSTITLADAPKTSRSGFLFPREGQQWIVTLAGMHDDKPPGDWDGYLEFAKGLRTNTIYNAIARAERIGEVQRFALPASTLRHFERLDRFPRGLLPMADAVCRFNPIYGQGMSVAAMEAALIAQLLSVCESEPDPITGLAQSYFTAVQELLNAPWSVANLDLVFPETTGKRPPNFGDSLKFGAGVIRLAARDPEVHRLWSEVQQLLKPNSALREPAFVERVKSVMAEA